jgi:predicted methyltransferase
MQTPRHLIAIAIAVLLLAACGGSQKEAAEPAADEPATPAATEPTEPSPEDEQALRAAIATEERPADDRARDEARKPYEVLRFFDIRPGMHVADLGAGFGYLSEIMARTVGPEGRVYLQNSPLVIERFAAKPLGERLARLDMPHIQRLDSEFDELGLPTGELDAVIMVLFYHDTLWMPKTAGGNIDRAKMNRAIFDALKPGGVFGVIDHHAQDGSRDRDVNTIHRIDAALVKEEILAAGFELDAESDMLRHPDDDRTKNVFDPSLRGHTDQFVYRFRKPR